VLAALDRLLHRLRVPHRLWWRLCDAHDLALGVPDTPENFPLRHGYVRLQHIYTGASGYMDKATCSHCGRSISDPHPCLLARAEAVRGGERSC
jgi:hypothetical protein